MTEVYLVITGYLDVAITMLIAVMALCAMWQPSRSRRIAAAVFVGGVVAHNQIFHALSDDQFWYYISAAAADLAAIIILSNLRHLPRLAYDLATVATVSLIFNAIGFGMYGLEETVGAYAPAAALDQGRYIYVFLYVLLYTWAAYLLLRGDPKDVGAGDMAMGSWLSLFRFDAVSRGVFNRSGKGERAR